MAGNRSVFRMGDACWGSGVVNFRLAGQYFDAETGLHYNYHRYYDPATGRYLAADPIGLAGGINLFAYTENNPLNGIDPYGLFDIALTPYAVAAAPAIAMADSPFLPFGDIAAGALIGLAMIHDKAEEGIPDPSNSSNGSCPNGDDDGDHGKQRKEQADAGDSHRQVGDPNRVVREGRRYIDSETGHNVYVKGDRVVIRDSIGKPVTQFKNPRSNTLKRIENGKWIPK